MITKNDVIDAINERLVTRWPDRTVYVEVCPIDFDRPSFWLFADKDKITQATRHCVRRDLRVRLTIYDQWDEHYDISWHRLSNDMDAAAALLLEPLSVCGRKLKAAITTLPRDPDTGVIQIDFSWLDNMPGHKDDTAVPAGNYSVRTSIK